MSDAAARMQLIRPDDPVELLPIHYVLAHKPPPAPAELVADTLLADDVNLWVGHGGHAKSTAALHVALCVASDRPAFGTQRVARAGRVLLVVPEDGAGPVHMMLSALCAGLGVRPQDVQHNLAMIAEDYTLALPRDARRLGVTAREFGAVLVVIDPKRDVLGGADENDAATAQAVVGSLRQYVCRTAGASVLLLDHLRKPERGTDAAATVHDVRGSGSWTQAARLVFAVSKRGNRVTLQAVKANRRRADLRHEVDLHVEAHEENAALWTLARITNANAGATSEALTPGVGRALNDNERAALEALDDRHEPGLRLSWSSWHSRSGIASANTFKGVRGRLLDAQLAEASATGRKTRNGSSEYSYGITPAGRAQLPAKGEGVR